MSEETEKREIGFICGACDYDVVTWKIPNISSIPHEVDYVVQSPQLSYGGASWVLKMYPYGQIKYETEGYVDLIIERLHSQVEKHDLHFRIFCENTFQGEFKFLTGGYSFEPACTEAKRCRFMQNLEECPEKWQFAPNDTFTLVFGFGKYATEASDDSGFQITSRKNVLGKNYLTKRKNRSLDTGEIFKDHFCWKSFVWKVCIDRVADENGKVGSFQFPKDYQVQSPRFYLHEASWILKLYPYFRMEKFKKPKCDVVLERLDSKIPEHRVMLRIHLDQGFTKTASGSFIFNSHRTQGSVITFQWEDKDIPSLSCLHFEIDMCSKRNLEMESNSSKVMEPIMDEWGTSRSVHQSKILQNYRKLYLTQEDCDVSIKVKGQEFLAHKLILKAQSPVFASAFRIDMKEKATGVIDVEDCEPSTFSDFLCFLYCGEAEKISKENVHSLFTVADKYGVSGLRTLCMEFMKQNLSVDTFCNTVTLALLHSEAELIRMSTDFFTKNLQEIIVTVDWQSFIVENPIQGNELIIKALVPKTSQRDGEKSKEAN